MPGTKDYSGWKPTHLTSVFSLQTSVLLPPDGTTLTAFTDVNTDVADRFPPTQRLACYGNLPITDVKSFTTMGPVVIV